MSMFCFQCQEAARGTGCSIRGTCGKSDRVANLQDTLIFTVKGVSYYVALLNKQNVAVPESVYNVINVALFTTITNANFDADQIVGRIKEAQNVRNQVLELARSKGIDTANVPDCAIWTGTTEADFLAKAASSGVLSTENEDVRSLRELLIYGVKGLAAYNDHAWKLGYKQTEINAFTARALASTVDNTLSSDELVALVLECGKFGVDSMALLDKANTESFGNPELTRVNLGTRNNPAILISGHDLNDMDMLLKQTQGTGVDVYTHSEMLPGHYYPAFKKYENLVGNYGNAWWAQDAEIESFNGPVLFTTNCITPVKDSYKDRVYTTGAAGYEGCTHIPDKEDGSKDFSDIIEHAKKCAPPTPIESGEIVGGFAHNQVLSLADKVVDAVKSGAIRKFFVMAGCDGRMDSRKYYTEFAKALPDDTIILTAGCAKYRYNKLDLGDIGGIPRVLDAGQCNDSYSLAVIALKLKEVFGLDDVNELPISYNIAWYEQKAVIVLLALLYLGVKNIHLGPTLPAFLSPNVANVLIAKFGISGINTVDEDIAHFLALAAG